MCPEPGCPTIVEGGGRCARHGRPTKPRPTTTEQGYGSAWRRVRDRFIARHRVCVDCGGPSSVADHDPVTRRELVARGDPDPDAEHHLVPRCGPCHSRKTALFDGAFGNRPKVREGGRGRDANSRELL